MKSLTVLLNSHTLYLKMQKRISPPQIIITSFMLVIILGGVLLYLPVSHQPNVEVSLIDAFFTATSAVCVTGLVTLTTATTWSLFGKTVILLLIQIGGLSLITILTYFFVHLKRKVTLKDRLTVQAAFNINDLSGIVRMVMLVIRGTFICETVGTILLFVSFMNQSMKWNDAIFYAFFHAVSAFCNAGFDLIGSSSLEPYVGNVLVNVVIMVLIVLGGIGFSVWRDIYLVISYKIKPGVKQRIQLSLHSKLAMIVTVILIVLGALFFLKAEFQNPATLGNLTLPDKFMASFFQSITLRTAGFGTIPQGGLHESSKMISSIFMMIGGSPGGTAGGIKTVTLAIIFCCVWSTLKGRSKIIMFKRTLSNDILQKAVTIITVMILLWMGGTVLLAFTEQSSIFPHSFVDLLFEVSSALGTVGLTTGITPYLSILGKIIIMICMFIGRIGPLSIILSVKNRSDNVNEKIQYPNGQVMIG